MVGRVDLPELSVVVAEKGVFHLDGLLHVGGSFVRPKEGFLVDSA